MDEWIYNTLVQSRSTGLASSLVEFIRLTARYGGVGRSSGCVGGTRHQETPPIKRLDSPVVSLCSVQHTGD